jgi:hypothetical protein
MATAPGGAIGVPHGEVSAWDVCPPVSSPGPVQARAETEADAPRQEGHGDQRRAARRASAEHERSGKQQRNPS